MKNTVSTFHKVRALLRKLFKHPTLDWYFMLSCFAFGLILIFIANTFLYITFVVKGSESVSEASTTVILFDGKEVKDILIKIESRTINARVIPASVQRGI